MDSRSSSEENDVVRRRSYECVFCKRGFTTAQALGGHMNIHRKDRSSPKSAAAKPDPNNYNNNNNNDHQSNFRGTYYYAYNYNTTSSRPLHHCQPAFSGSQNPAPAYLDLFGAADHRQSMEKEAAVAGVVGGGGGGELGDGLDLELRLGHDRRLY